ncbi:unnamed protein product, partial [Symbiodinium necroappetens]
VHSNTATQRAVRDAVKRQFQHGGRVEFEVRRWGVPDGGRGMLQFTTNGRRDHLVPMLDIAKGILQEFHVVLFMEGTLAKPKTRLGRQVIKELDGRDMAFKAVDCSDEKANPGIRNVTAQLTGEEVLPQLFIDGVHVAGGRAILQALQHVSTTATPDLVQDEEKCLERFAVEKFAFLGPVVKPTVRIDFVGQQQRGLHASARRRPVCLRASETLAETEVQDKLLSDAWEHALLNREGSVFTEPELFAEILGSLNEPGEKQGPVYFERVTRASSQSQDIVLYVPGIDFSGGFAAPQFRPLAEAGHELWRCWVAADNRTPFVEMVDRLEAWVRSQQESGRQVVLFGESFGGLLSLAVALRMGGEALKGLVLVNPATSFDRTIWPLLGRALTALPNAPDDLPAWSPHQDIQDLFQDLQSRATLSPYPYVAGSALTGTVADSTQLGRLFSKIALNLLSPKKAQDGPNLDPEVENFLLYPENLAQLLPPETVRFRLRHWLRDGCEIVNSELRRRRGSSFGGAKLPPTLLLASDNDRLLISDKEAERLRGVLRARCGDKRLQVVELKDSGHAPLDGRVNIAELLKDSPIYKKPSSRNYVDDFEFPTLEKLEQGSRNIEPIAALVSPVFCSWDEEVGTRRFGLEGVPDPKALGRPVLLVGNHQLFALDLGPLVREFLIEKGYAARGLAHPINFPEVFSSLVSTTVTTDDPGFLDSTGLPFELRAAAKAGQKAVEELTGQGKKNQPMGPFGMGAGEHADMESDGELGVGENFGVGGAFAKWGAVPVTPRNFVRLLQRNEAVLLFPGGAREACHGPTEKYQLFWPSQTDFVRAAARFNAIIVPFGGVGSADNVRVSERSEEQAEQLIRTNIANTSFQLRASIFQFTEQLINLYGPCVEFHMTLRNLFTG